MFGGKQLVRWIAMVLILAMMIPVGLAETAEEIAMHPYTDETDGTTFMLPDGWIENMEPQYGFNSVVAYTDHVSSGRKVIFMHLSADDWENGQQYTSSRTEYDNLMNQLSIMQMNFGTTDIEEVEFNGITYFRYMSQESTWQ